ENDLVIASFGRGFFILDDLTPIRDLNETTLDQKLALFPVKQAWMFIPQDPLGLPDKSFQGDAMYSAPNPPFGAIFTYYLKEDLKTEKKARNEKEKDLEKEGKDTPYPEWQELQSEDREEEPSV